MLGFHNFIFV